MKSVPEPSHFSLGRTVATPGALAAANGTELLDFLSRHRTGDWGKVDAYNAREYEGSVRRGFRVLSAYRVRSGTRLSVITEADRLATTLLLPDEY